MGECGHGRTIVHTYMHEAGLGTRRLWQEARVGRRGNGGMGKRLGTGEGEGAGVYGGQGLTL